jgi:hypothetical protein
MTSNLGETETQDVTVTKHGFIYSRHLAAEDE